MAGAFSQTVSVPAQAQGWESQLSAQRNLIVSSDCLCWFRTRTWTAPSQNPTKKRYQKRARPHEAKSPALLNESSSCVEVVCPDGGGCHGEMEKERKEKWGPPAMIT